MGSSDILLCADVACSVISFVGGGNYLFLAINKAWEEAHKMALGVSNTSTVVATRYMSLPLMTEILESDAPYAVDLMNVLAKKGLFTFARMASKAPYYLHMFSPTTFGWAAYSGNVVMTAFIGRRKTMGCFPANKHHALRAAEGGSVEVIRFLLRENHMPEPGSFGMVLLHDSMVEEALQNGRLEVLDLLLNDDAFKAKIGGFEWEGWADIFGRLAASARAGDVRTLDWFVMNAGVKAHNDVTNVMCTEAAGSGNLGTLKFLKSRGHHFSRSAFRAAGRAGSRAMLDWMVTEGGCVPHEDIYIEASTTGNIEAIRWAIDYGLVCPAGAIENAKYCGKYRAMLLMSKARQA